MTWTLRTAIVGVLVGVYEFNTNDVGVYLLYRDGACCLELSLVLGLTELITKVWTA